MFPLSTHKLQEMSHLTHFFSVLPFDEKPSSQLDLHVELVVLTIKYGRPVSLQHDEQYFLSVVVHDLHGYMHGVCGINKSSSSLSILKD